MSNRGNEGRATAPSPNAIPICSRCGPTRTWRRDGVFLKLRCRRCGGRLVGLRHAPAAVDAAAAAGADDRLTPAAARDKGIMVNGNHWPGLHLVKLSPAGVPPVLIVSCFLDADAGVCEIVQEPAPGVEQFIAGEAVARLGLRGDRITHALRGEGGRRVPAEVAPLLRRVPALVRAGGDLVDAVMTAVERQAHADKPPRWLEGYAAAIEDLLASRPFYEFMARLSYTRPHMMMVPAYVKGEATKADAAGGDHG